MMWKFLFLFFVFHTTTVCLSEDAPEVDTPLGLVRGAIRKSFGGKNYAAYEGIPYAKPPIGELRFEEAQPVEPWIGVWNATRTYSCIQGSLFPQDPTIAGDEDCLYLNVYAPAEKPEKPLDVVAIIHGGWFMMGNGHISNDTVLMDKDIVLVTMNYRLGILGFLSTEDDSIPGNNGLKDQVLALQWIKDNIASFGGDPKSVTIAGLSAGGASVHLHYFSPLSKDLFVRGIAQSGTALNPWVIKENPLENVKKLATLVGCPDSSTTELKQCLKQRPARLLLGNLEHFYGFGPTPLAPFAPVVEKNSKNPFLPENPVVLLTEKKVLDAPIIFSTTTHEGIFPTLFFYHILQEINEEWSDFAHLLLDYNYTVPVSKREGYARKIREHYLGDDGVFALENIVKVIQIFTDRLFTLGVENAAKLQSEVVTSPVYYYLFNYEKGESRPLAPGVNKKGVGHGSDGIFFYGFLRPLADTDLGMKDICQNILYSFVTTGKPSFDGSDIWLPTKGSTLTYLNITDVDDIKIQTAESLASKEFWADLGIVENEHIVVKDEL